MNKNRSNHCTVKRSVNQSLLFSEYYNPTLHVPIACLDCSEKYNKPSSHSSAGRSRVLSFWSFCHYATNCYLFCHKLLPILPQISTYFASIMPVASRGRLCQLLCRQIRLKPTPPPHSSGGHPLKNIYGMCNSYWACATKSSLWRQPLTVKDQAAKRSVEETGRYAKGEVSSSLLGKLAPPRLCYKKNIFSVIRI